MTTDTADRILVFAFVTAAVGNGLVAGVFFAFSSFVMPALARLSPAVGVAAMQSINVSVVRSAFLATYAATTVLAAVLSVAPWWFNRGRAPHVAAVAGVLSVLGSFGVTMWFNVPLNDLLAKASPHASATAALWTTYLHDWGLANAARGVASGLASVLFTYAALINTAVVA